MGTKIALVTGVTGQDGAYLARLLLDKGYEVHGCVRRSSTPNTWRLEEAGIRDEVRPVLFDLAEYSNIRRAIEIVRPDEVYNLAAQSFVAASFEQPIYTADITGVSAARILEAIREVQASTRFYQASTSEMFGLVQSIPQNELTPFHPRSPYGAAKLYAHWMTVNYRESYGIHASNGILFNHESPLRGIEFVTRKITAGFAEIRHGRRKSIALGNLDARRDWGFAGDYVDGMWRMLQQETADDYVLATGEAHTVREFVEWSAAAAGFAIEWRGSGKEERGVDQSSGADLVVVDERLYRPAEVDILLGDAQKARRVLSWQPRMTVRGLAEIMVEADLRRASQQRILA